MSLTKITVSGQVTKTPEKRYTEDNLAISSFMLDFGYEGQEKLVRVISIGRLADKTADTIKKGQTVLVEGRLQTNVKNEGGVDKKLLEINAQGIEIIEKSADSYQPGSDNSNETNGINSEDLIGEEEIPF